MDSSVHLSWLLPTQSRSVGRIDSAVTALLSIISVNHKVIMYDTLRRADTRSTHYLLPFTVQCNVETKRQNTLAEKLLFDVLIILKRNRFIQSYTT